MELGKKIKLNLQLIGNALFRGMKNADTLISSQVHNGGIDDVFIQQQIKNGGVLNDLMENKETQAVKELRDSYYRLMYEADKYKIKMTFDENGDLVNAKSVKTEDGRWNKHCKVYEEDGYPLRIIQDNARFEKHNFFNTDLSEEIAKYMPGQQIDYCVLLTTTFNGFTPRFMIDKYVKKMVIKEDPEDKEYGIWELYLSEYQEQFNKIHAIILKNLYDLNEGKLRNPDFIDFETLSFVTDGKAWNCSPGMEFKIKDIEYKGCKRWDGNFILTFRGKYEKNCVSVGEKFRTKEMDEKYANKTMRNEGETIDLFTAYRHINDNNENEEEK